MTIAWTKQCRERAQRDGRHLVKLQVQSRYVQGSGSSIDMSADVDADLAEELLDWIVRWTARVGKKDSRE